MSGSADRCEQCVAGFVVKSNGECAREIANCEGYNGVVCQNCKGGFYLSKGQDQCVEAQPGCIYTEGECTSCAVPFSPKHGKCFI